MKRLEFALVEVNKLESSRNVSSEECLPMGVSWCCGHYCLLAFVLWCGYCSVSFQSFVLRHWCPQHQETTLPIGNVRTNSVKCEAVTTVIKKALH